MTIQQNIPPDKAPGVIDYLQIIHKYRKFVAICTGSVSVVVAGVSLLLTPEFLSTAKILVPQQESSIMSSILGQVQSAVGISGELTGRGTKIDLYIELLKSEPILDSIIDRFKIMEANKFTLRRNAYLFLQKHFSASQVVKTEVLTISFKDKNPQMAADIANAFVEELDRRATQLKANAAGGNRAFLEERLAKTKAELAQSEDAIKEFQKKNKIIQVPEQATATIKGIAELHAVLAEKEIELSVLRRSLTDSTKEVKNAMESIRNLRGQIARLESQNNGASMPTLGAMPQLGQEYVRLMRSFKTHEAVFEVLTRQYEMARVSEVNTTSAIQIIQPARPAEIRSYPARTKMVLIAAFVSFIISTFGCFIIEALNRLSDGEKNRWKSLCRLW